MLLDDIVREVNTDTVPSSFDRNLVRGKLWLALNLSQIRNEFDTIYVLGSWYGNMAIVLSQLPIQYQRIVNVELDDSAIKKSRQLITRFGVKHVTHMLANANELDYCRLRSNGLVINTSVNNISDTGWFDHIPSGTMVAMLARNQDPRAINQFRNVQDLDNKFPLSEILYKGTLTDQDPETEFDHFLVIGLK